MIPYSNIDKDKIIYPLPEELAIFEDYLNQNDKFDTLIKSFHITNFNFHQILYNFTMHTDDILIRTNGLPSDDFIVINTLIINYLSTAKMFIDIVENFDSSLNNMIHSFTSQKYDSNFYYQLMTALRNFSLHGHLPVFKNSNRYCFNLNYILEEGKRFNFSKSSKEKIEEITQKIREEHQDIANISFSRTIVEYHKVNLEIFNQFFTVNASNFLEKYNKFQTVLKKYKGKQQNDSICVALDNTLHLVKTSCGLVDSFKKEQQLAEGYLNNHIENFKRIIK